MRPRLTGKGKWLAERLLSNTLSYQNSVVVFPPVAALVADKSGEKILVHPATVSRSRSPEMPCMNESLPQKPASHSLTVPLPAGRHPPPGRVIFVGAGPGEPDLLTTRAINRLKAADVVVHDQLVPQAVLQLTGSPCLPISRLLSGNRSTSDPGKQIGNWLADLASPGRVVVRLKGGDPTVFARLSEELEPLTERNIPFEIVPGVTAATAAAASAAVPLTSRETASSLTIVTGHEAALKQEAIDYSSLAAVTGTIVIYMGIEQSPHWSEAFLRAGRPADTPVTLVSRCSWADQQIVATTLAECATAIRDAALPAPAIAIIGSHPAGRPVASHRPLAGVRLLVTRPAGQGDQLIEAISQRGGEAVHLPLIEIGPAPEPAAVEAAIASAWSFDWIIFASMNGVRAFHSCLRNSGRDARALGTARLAAIGPATREALEACGLTCDLMPDCYRSEGILEAISDSVPQGRFLLVRADKGRDLLRQELEARGHQVEQVAAYSSRPVPTIDSEAQRTLQQFPCDWIVLTSSSIATAAVQLFGDQLTDWKIASISPVTSATLIAAGFPPTVEADEATTTSLLAAIEDHHQSSSGSANRANSNDREKPTAARPPESGTG